MSNFGANFRKAREAAGLPLEKIAAETRISTRFLAAIENEAFQQLPGGIFNRGFIRAYAEYLGLDSNQAVADYDRISAASQEPTDVLHDVERAPARTSDWNLYLVAAAILIVLMVAYYFVTRKSGTPQPPPDPGAAQLATPSPADVSIPAATPAVPPEAGHTAPLPSVPTPAAAALPATPAPAASTPTPRPLTPGPTASAVALAVDVNVTDSTWMKVTTDGAVALSEVLQAGTNRRFSAERSIDVVIGNAAGATMQINGRDLGQLGAAGRVRQFRITPENAAQIR